MGRPLSDKKREELVRNLSSQIDTDAQSTKKGRRDSMQTEKLINYNEQALFGDKVYVNSHHKYSARYYGWYYEVLDKAKRGQPLTGSQKKRNRKLNLRIKRFMGKP